MDNTILQSKPLISIIIPIYKVEQYLRFCLDSVRNQTYRNLQVILINDGSPDNCESICKEYCELDDRFEYYYRKNQGLGLTRNYGLSLAKGEFVSFLDSDDAIHPQQIEILYKLLETHPKCSISIGNYIRFSEDIEEKHIYNLNEIPFTISTSNIAINRLICSDLKAAVSIQTSWNKLYRKACIKDSLFHEVSPAEDIYFGSQVYSKIEYFIETECILYYYRHNPNSITASITFKSILINIERFADLYKIVEKSKFYKCKEKILQCIIRKYLSARYLKNSSENIYPTLLDRCENLRREYFPLYLKSNDSLKMKFFLSIFMLFPFTYSLFRTLCEWKAKYAHFHY